MKRAHGLFCALIFIAATAPCEQRTTPASWTGDLGFGLAWTGGNTETASATVKFHLNRAFVPEVKLATSFAYLYSSSDRIKTGESTEIGGRLDILHAEGFFSYYEIMALRDRFKDYDYRLMPGLGLGYRLIASGDGELTVNAGLTQVYTRYYESGQREDYTGLQVGNRFSWKISPTAEMTQGLKVIPKLDAPRIYSAQLDFSLSAALTGNWAVMVSLVDRYDSQPQDQDLKKNDTIVTVGLTRKF